MRGFFSRASFVSAFSVRRRIVPALKNAPPANVNVSLRDFDFGSAVPSSMARALTQPSASSPLEYAVTKRSTRSQSRRRDHGDLAGSRPGVSWS